MQGVIVPDFWIFCNQFVALSIKILPIFSLFRKYMLANFMYFQDLLLGANHTPDNVIKL